MRPLSKAEAEEFQGELAQRADAPAGALGAALRPRTSPSAPRALAQPPPSLWRLLLLQLLHRSLLRPLRPRRARAEAAAAPAAPAAKSCCGEDCAERQGAIGTAVSCPAPGQHGTPLIYLLSQPFAWHSCRPTDYWLIVLLTSSQCSTALSPCQNGPVRGQGTDCALSKAVVLL